MMIDALIHLICISNAQLLSVIVNILNKHLIQSYQCESLAVSISRIINIRAGRKFRWHPVSKAMIQNRLLSLTAPSLKQLIPPFYSLLIHPLEISSITHFTVVSGISYKSIPFTNCETLQGTNTMYVFLAPCIVSDTLENKFFF